MMVRQTVFDRGPTLVRRHLPDTASLHLPAPPIRLQEREVHLWSFRLDMDPTGMRSLQTSLDHRELCRAERFRTPKLRQGYIVGRATLRSVLSFYLELPPVEITLEETEFGRPYVVTGQNPQALDFNLSHAFPVGLIGVVRGMRVGVDIERIHDLAGMDEIAARTFSQGEMAEVGRLPREGRREAFFRAWTRKEACLKALGQGLMGDLHSVDVGAGSSHQETWTLVAENGSTALRLAVCPLDVLSGFTASVAVTCGG